MRHYLKIKLLVVKIYLRSPYLSNICAYRFFPRICNAFRPFLPPLSVLVTACCVGAPLAINIESVMSPFGVTILFLIIAFHLSAFVAGYVFPGLAFHKAHDVKALQRTLSYETGAIFLYYRSLYTST